MTTEIIDAQQNNLYPQQRRIAGKRTTCILNKEAYRTKELQTPRTTERTRKQHSDYLQPPKSLFKVGKDIPIKTVSVNVSLTKPT